MKKFNIKAILSMPMSLLISLQLIQPFGAAGQTIANDVYVYQYLTEELSLNHAAASGLMANIYKESTFQPTASCTDINGLTSYGIMQWNGVRFEQLKGFCEARGLGYDTLEGQLEYLANDLYGAYSGYYDYLLTGIPDTAEGAYDAAYFWAAEYEVCSRKYFEQRASLARDFYYPEFMLYAPVTAEIMGEELYVSLADAENGMFLAENKKKQLALEETQEVWRFTRTGTCTYEAVNAKTGRSLSPDGEKYSWHFVKSDEGYMLEEESTGLVLGCDKDGAVQLQENTGEKSQSFMLTEFTPAEAPAEIRAYYEAAPSVTEFQWEQAEGADGYRLKIYSGNKAEGTPVRVVSGITDTSCRVSLRSGEYTAEAESENKCGFAASDPVTFTVEQQEAADLGEEFLAKISWNDEQQYLTVTESLDVNSAPADHETDQLWSFSRNDDGSYTISGYDNSESLSAEADGTAALLSDAEKKSTWVIYGDKDTGYILEHAERELVLSVAEESEYKLREYADINSQRFEIENYTFLKPVIEADASGGVLEPVSFTWTKSDCADGYTLRVMDEDGDVTAALKIRDNDSEADVVLREGAYTAEISAVSAVTGEKTVSERTEFQVLDLPERPYAELQLSACPMEISFGWKRSSTADRYSYRITDASTGEVVRQKRSVKGSSDKASLPAGDYILTVTAYNENGSIDSYGTDITVRDAGVVSVRSVLASKKHSDSIDN